MSLPPSAVMPSSHAEAALTNGHDDASHSASAPKKAASKSRKAAPKTTDEASRLLQARINQLEQDNAAEKDSALEIGESSIDLAW